MIPYADLLYFGVSLYVVVPAIALGLAGRLSCWWAALATLLMLIAQFALFPPASSSGGTKLLLVVGAWVMWQWAVARSFLALRSRERPWLVWVAVFLSLAPLLLVKFVPSPYLRSTLGFLGISYVTFRALDAVLAVHDELVMALSPARFGTYVLFFPTLSAGPIDRFRRFEKDLATRPTRREYLGLLDQAVHLFFIGLLYKFVMAVLVRRYWLDAADAGRGVRHTVSYMYAYSAYLFFDFAGYSAFATAYSRILGVQTPPNFNRPFLARNIADFWARWHISLSSYLRDQVYMRFLLAATKRRWFTNRHVASAMALLLVFGAMGVWHGTATRYIVYGLYHAALMIAYEWWRRTRPKRDPGNGWTARRVAATLLTVQAACFGFLIFSGRLF